MNSVVAQGGMIVVERPEDVWNRVGLGEWTQHIHAVHGDHEPGESKGKAYYLTAADIGWPSDDERIAEDEEVDFADIDAQKQAEATPGRVNDETMALVAAVGSTVFVLDVATPSITDAGMQHVTSFANARLVFLAGAKITDAGAARLATLDKVELIDLKDTAITDKTLELLAALPRLHWLRVEGTQVTPDGVRKLKQALPGLRVTPDPDAPRADLAEDE